MIKVITSFCVEQMDGTLQHAKPVRLSCIRSKHAFAIPPLLRQALLQLVMLRRLSALDRQHPASAAWPEHSGAAETSV